MTYRKTISERIGIVQQKPWNPTKVNDMTTKIPDFTLLRNLAEDVPDMAPSVRAHLVEIANRLEFGEKLVTTRCDRCGHRTDVMIRTVKAG